MNKEKIMLIAGCSHAAGSEINGTEDSAYNRTKSFGNILAQKMNHKPVNIAMNGAANAGIARSILEWFDKYYDKEKMDVFVIIAWTESVRIEVPSDRPFWYEGSSKCCDWFDDTSNLFYRINMGWEGLGPEEKEIYSYFQKFIVKNNTFVEIMSANLVIQMQYFLKMHGIDYVMCNAMHMFTLPNKHLEVYTDLIDKTKYMDWCDNDRSFFWYYRNKGYENKLAKYWHHDETPHSLYSDELYNFIGANKCL